MLQALFHLWERRLAAVTKDRVVRPFDWGLDWIPQNGTSKSAAAAEVLSDWVSHVMADTDAFFTPPPTTAYELTSASDGTAVLTFPSALDTPHPENNTVYARLFRTRIRDAAATLAGPRAAVLVLPQWNSDAAGHVGLC